MYNPLHSGGTLPNIALLLFWNDIITCGQESAQNLVSQQHHCRNSVLAVKAWSAEPFWQHWLWHEAEVCIKYAWFPLKLHATWKLFPADYSLMNQLWCHIIATAALKSFIVHSYKFCVLSWIFEISSCRQVSNNSKLGSKDECIIYIWSYLNHWHKGTFMQLCVKVWGKKVWSGRIRLQYQAELSVLIFQMSNNTYSSVWPAAAKRQRSKRSPDRDGWHFSIQETDRCT